MHSIRLPAVEGTAELSSTDTAQREPTEGSSSTTMNGGERGHSECSLGVCGSGISHCSGMHQQPYIAHRQSKVTAKLKDRQRPLLPQLPCRSGNCLRRCHLDALRPSQAYRIITQSQERVLSCSAGDQRPLSRCSCKADAACRAGRLRRLLESGGQAAECAAPPQTKLRRPEVPASRLRAGAAAWCPACPPATGAPG